MPEQAQPFFEVVLVQSVEFLALCFLWSSNEPTEYIVDVVLQILLLAHFPIVHNDVAIIVDQFHEVGIAFFGVATDVVHLRELVGAARKCSEKLLN